MLIVYWPIVHFTVTGGNKAGVDLVFIRPFLLYYASGYCGAFACLFSPGGGAFANFVLSGDWAFANPGAIFPSF